MTVPPFRGGERVAVVRSHIDELNGRELIVVAPEQAYLRVSARAVQCFDPLTGMIWPFAPEQLAKQ